MPKIQKDYIFVAYLCYVKQIWHGILDVVKKYGDNIFDINDNYINVTLPFDKEVMAFKSEWNSKCPYDMEKRVGKSVISPNKCKK